MAPALAQSPAARFGAIAAGTKLWVDEIAE
jgi:hypothetical protein